MNSLNTVIIKFSVALALGIATAAQLPQFDFSLLKIIWILFAISIAVMLLHRKKLRSPTVFGFLLLLFFFVSGVAIYVKDDPAVRSNHYVRHASYNDQALVELKVNRVLQPTPYEHRYYSEIISMDNSKVHGNILLKIKSTGSYTLFEPGDQILVYGNLESIKDNLNPDQFDYRKYLSHKKVFAAIRIEPEHILSCRPGDPSMMNLAFKIRRYLLRNLENSSLGVKERGVLQALVLGYREDISKESQQKFADAGAIHILAVSGLHVGVLFLFLSRLFFPVTYIPQGKKIRALIIVLLLWGYAIVVGASPSVVRAVTMFTCFAIAESLNRPTNSFNTLFLSFFFLLWIEPRWLFQVGFQMSYLAVFFIIWLQPAIYKLYQPRFALDRLLWGITSVSLAAQLGVAPLSIYYFHQFPGLFLLTNVVIMPFMALLLISGILVVALAGLQLLPTFLAEYYNLFCNLLIQFIEWVAGREQFIIRDIAISFVSLSIGYGIIIFAGRMLVRRKRKHLFFCLGLCVLLISAEKQTINSKREEQLILFHKTKSTLLAHQKDRKLMIHSNSDSTLMARYPIKNYSVENRIKDKTMLNLPPTFKFQQDRIFLVDSLGFYPNRDIDVVILIQSPKIHLDRLIDSLRPEIVVADGSNYLSFIHRWKMTCIQRKIPFHYTGEKGAYVFK